MRQPTIQLRQVSARGAARVQGCTRKTGIVGEVEAGPFTFVAQMGWEVLESNAGAETEVVVSQQAP